MDLRKSK